jgi:hypothetical protein
MKRLPFFQRMLLLRDGSGHTFLKGILSQINEGGHFPIYGKFSMGGRERFFHSYRANGKAVLLI